MGKETMVRTDNEQNQAHSGTREYSTQDRTISVGELLERYSKGEREFAHINLRGADLSEAILSGSNLPWAILKGAELIGADLSGANLQGANLRGADLSGTLLTDTNLEDADLRGSDLMGADLRGARLAGANLRASDCDAFTRFDAQVPIDRLGLNVIGVVADRT